jgi:hypothetical protein
MNESKRILDGTQHQGVMKSASTCSSESPFVSGRRMKKKMVPMNEKLVYNQKAPDDEKRISCAVVLQSIWYHIW